MEKVILVVFQDGLPWMVTITDNGESYSTYAVDHCKADDELYFYWCASGPINDGNVSVEECSGYWLADGYLPYFTPGCEGGKRLANIEEKWKQHPDKYAIRSETVYCNICDDCIPTVDVIENACEHIHWDVERGWWAGDGYSG